MSAARTLVAVPMDRAEIESEEAGWAVLPPANEPLRRERVYRLVTHPGVAPDRGEPLVVGWLRSLIDEHDEAGVDASRASGRLAA